MHDFRLGPPIDVGEYAGPLVDGKPLHDGTCEDGVYGCRRCNNEAKKLTVAQLEALGWSTTGTCDFCKVVVPIREISGLMDHEDHTYHQVCLTCRKKWNDAVAKELEEERQRFPQWFEED